MTYLPTAEHDELRAVVRELAVEQIAPRAAAIDETRRVSAGPQGAAGEAGSPRHLLRRGARRDGARHRRADDPGRGDRARRRHHQPHPDRPEARRPADHDRRQHGAEGPILPAPRLRGVAHRVRADRGGRRQRRGVEPDAGDPRRRRLRPERQQAVHHPRLGRRRGHRLRPDGSGGRRTEGDERVHRRDRHARLRRAAHRAQDGDPRVADRRADLRRRPGARRRT